MEDVAIIGAGLHPFGHFGPKSAIDVGADAIRAALTDAGVAWKDVQFAFGGSFEVDKPRRGHQPDRPLCHGPIGAVLRAGSADHRCGTG